MTKLSNTQTTKFRKASRFSMLALALSLSTGTVAGMFGIAALTSGPVQAQQGGNGGGGGGDSGGNGTAGGDAGPSPMAITHVVAPNDPNRSGRRSRTVESTRSEHCNGSNDGRDIQNCRYNLRSTPRIVQINGFAQCAIIQQMPNPNGGPADFYCLKPM